MRTKELSISQIGELLYCPKSIVKTSHNNLQERSNSKTLLILGRRWITSPRTYGRLVKESQNAWRQTLSQLHNDAIPHASIHTGKRALASVNIKIRRARKSALLKAGHSVNRLAWAMEYKNWTKENFDAMILCDKCMVEKSQYCNRVRYGVDRAWKNARRRPFSQPWPSQQHRAGLVLVRGRSGAGFHWADAALIRGWGEYF